MADHETWNRTMVIRTVWDMGAIVAIEQAFQCKETGKLEWREVPSVNHAQHHTTQSEGE